MATLELTTDRLVLRLSAAEKVLCLSGDVDVPLSAVADVRVEPEPLRAVRGLRAPGLALPRVVKVGTWRRRGHRSLVDVRAGVPAVRVLLDGAGPDELLVSDPDAAGLVERLQERLGRP